MTKKSVEIKVATAQDCMAVATLFDKYRQFYQQQSDLNSAMQFIDARISRCDSVILLASDASGAVGILQVYPTFSSISMANVWLINDLYVCESARGQGIAKRLINTCIELATVQQVKLLRISTEFSNTAASTLYEQIGFEKDTRFQHYNFFIKG
ncbi:GNAT family N-acetyltransferase [Pseudoalteromonas fenneropenaei]|uniref:GNAT family N-acetyltransferase n=1 Tax=Pseudoalteromonas fenneropenaei TaxID=1737459 RepID=A0ABV7CNV2_9GAMM